MFDETNVTIKALLTDFYQIFDYFHVSIVFSQILYSNPVIL